MLMDSSASSCEQRRLGRWEGVASCLDENGDGKISEDELRKCLKAIGEDLSEEEAELLFEGNADRLVGFQELLSLVEQEDEEDDGGGGGGGGGGSSNSKKRSRVIIRQAFEVFEMEGSGFITPVSLMKVLNEGLGMPSSIDECLLMIRRFDINGDELLSFDEFTNLFMP